MTLEQAVEVLNREKHRSNDTPWRISEDRRSVSVDFDEWLYAFEAIAIAREYLCAGMTLERAVEVLNREKFNNGEWRLDQCGVWDTTKTGHDPGDVFEEFEAIAIAQALERGQKP